MSLYARKSMVTQMVKNKLAKVTFFTNYLDPGNKYKKCTCNGPNVAEKMVMRASSNIFASMP
jgi:hypothetical protein